MSDRINVANTASPRFTREEDGGAIQAQVGSWRGEEVRVAPPDILSLLADAKEELTFAHSERIESKSIEDRKVEEDRPDLIERVQRIQEMLEELPDLDPDLVEVFRASIQAQDAKTADILREAGERFGDPSHRDAALRDAEAVLREAGDVGLADRVAEARAQLQTAEGPAIRAGLNVTRAAFDLSKGDLKAAAELRDSYRETVFGQPGPAGVYKGILDRFGTEGFAGQVKFLTRALGDDLLAAGPSIEPPRLRQLLEDLSALRMLDTVHDRCNEMTARLKRSFGTPVEATTVMQRLLPLTQENVSGPSKIRPIPEAVGLPAGRLDAQISCLREAREVMAMMPPAVYRDMDARFSLLGAMQEAMDLLIEKEEGA